MKKVIKFLKRDESVPSPSRAHETDVGIDVHAWKFVEHFSPCKQSFFNKLFCGGEYYLDKIVVDTGLTVIPPTGYYIEAVPNSRICKTDFVLANSVGIIDPDYRGTVKFIYKNINPKNKADYLFKNGDVCGQFILRKIEKADVNVEVDGNVEKTVSSTERGEGGFGSTVEKQ